MNPHLSQLMKVQQIVMSTRMLPTEYNWLLVRPVDKMKVRGQTCLYLKSMIKTVFHQFNVLEKLHKIIKTKLCKDRVGSEHPQQK